MSMSSRSSNVFRRPRGFTLVEMLVAMSIFIALGGALVAMSYQAMEAWRVGETKRLAYERAEAVFSQMALDLNAAYTRGPATAKGVPMARLFCTGGGGEPQRLSFVRTFETGPERSITYYAGSRKDAQANYTDSFTGDPRTLKPIGGLLGVTYYLDGRKLRRAALGPPATPTASLRSTTGGTPGEVLTGNVLYLGFRFWTQHTRSWQAAPPSPRGRKRRGGVARAYGPEIVWDSTRGAGVVAVDEKTGRRRPFALARGKASLDYPLDDVFPEIVEVTLVVEPDEKRAPRTELAEGLSMGGTVAYVQSTRGLAGPEGGSPFLLIGGEWVECSETLDGAYRIKRRGVRGTAAVSHDTGTEVRAGTTFVVRFHVPGYREDWTSEAEFMRRARKQ
jgi:type II secretory pathway component PulJ